MTRCVLFLFFFFYFTAANAQLQFDSTVVEHMLTSLPKQSGEENFDPAIIKAIEAIDRKYREISDTLFGYKSRRHTVLQTVLIKVNDVVRVNPLGAGSRLHVSDIIFDAGYRNAQLDSLSAGLSKPEREKLYKYLSANFDHFSNDTKTFHPQPVWITDITFVNKFVRTGIDIYGDHYLFTIDTSANWDVVKVEELWTY